MVDFFLVLMLANAGARADQHRMRAAREGELVSTGGCKGSNEATHAQEKLRRTKRRSSF
jgi:hypothetical protein